MAADEAPVTVLIQAATEQFDKKMAASLRAVYREVDLLQKKMGQTASVNDNVAQRVERGGVQAASGINKTSQAAGQLSFQLNDIATSLAGGMSPFQVMMQQGSQVTQVFSQMGGGIKSIGAAVGGALLSMINPVTALTFAFIFLAGKAVEYFTATEDGSDKANKELKKHAQALDQIISKYGDLAPKAKAVLANMLEASKAKEAVGELNKALAGMRLDAVTKLQEQLKAVSGVSNDAKRAVQDAFGDRTIFAQLGASFQELIDTIERGEDPTEKINKLITGLDALHLAAPNGGFDKMAETLRSILPLVAQIISQMNAVSDIQDVITNKSERMFQAFSKLAGPFGPLLVALRQVLPTLDEILAAPGQLSAGALAMPEAALEAATATPSAAKEFLKTKAASAKVAERMDYLDDAFAVALVKLFSLLPSSAQITSGVRTPGEQADAYARHLKGGGLAGKVSRHVPGQVTAEATAVDIGAGVDMETLREAVRLVPELEQLRKGLYEQDKVHVQFRGEARKAEVAAAQETMRLADEEYEKQLRGHEALTAQLVALDEQATLQERINEINSNANLSADEKAIAIEVETQLQKALNEAKQNGITVTEKEIELIRQKAAAAALAKLAAQDIKDADKAIADQQKEIIKTGEQIGQMAQTAISGLVNDLRNGVEAGEAFNNMLNRIIDSLINMALQSLFSPQGLGGVFSSLFGGLLGVPAAAKGGEVGRSSFPTRTVSPAVFAGAPQMSSGGSVGLRADEVPIIAHKGEMIIPKDIVRQHRDSVAGMISAMDERQHLWAKAPRFEAGGVVGTTSSVPKIAASGSTPVSTGGNTYSMDNAKISIDMSQSGLVAGNSEEARQFGKQVQKLIQLEMVRESRPGGLLRKVPA